MAKAVTDAPAEEEEGAEGQRVASDDPLQVRRAKSNSRLIVGSAMLTMLKSSWSTNWAATTSPRAVPIRWAFEVVLVIDAGPLDGERAGGSEPSLAPRSTPNAD